MSATIDGGVLRLTGYVGDYLYDDGFTSGDVVSALTRVEAGSHLTVHINSAGGIAVEGAAIHAILTARAGRTDIVVEGVAMSAGSLIAMAGETVTMSAGAVMMIHDPSAYTFGTAAQHLKHVAELETLATAYARVYADKSGKTVAECRQIMIDETWFTPEQAVEAGFADATTERRAEPVAAFDYRVFEKAPERLVALAKRRKWRTDDADHSPKGPDMSNTRTPPQSAVATATARIKAILTGEEAKGRQEMAEHLAYETELTSEAAIAIMAKAPRQEEFEMLNPDEQRRLNAEGLNRSNTSMRGDGGRSGFSLAGAMKRRHGID